MTWESRPLATADDPTDYSLRRIANGDFDGYLTTFVHDITTLGLPFVLRFDHEMNGNWYRWAEPDPHYDNAKGDYVAAWRHVHDLSRKLAPTGSWSGRGHRTGSTTSRACCRSTTTTPAATTSTGSA